MNKKSLIYSVFLFGGLFLATSVVMAQQTQTKKEVVQKQTTQYTCPMHPEIVQNTSGKCQKCGMNLVEKEKKPMYTCSMHPEVKSDKPGECPKCGMNLVEMKADKMHHKNDSTMIHHPMMKDSVMMKHDHQMK